MRTPRRVLLLNPGSLYGGEWAGRYPVKPALLGLFSYLAANGVPVEVLDLQMELGNPEPHQVDAYLARGRELLARRTFDLLAVSCWSSLEYLAALRLTEYAREAEPRARIVVGGYHPTAAPEEFARPGSPFDVVVRGEGEQALLELAADGRAGRRYGAGDGGSAGRRRPLVVDGRPLPADRIYADFAGYPYVKGRPATLGVYLSRGCPFHCAFCMEGAKGSAWRPYPVDEALRVVKSALGLRPHVLTFQDACFGYRASWRREFLSGLVDLGVDVPLWAEARADRLAADDMDLMQRLELYLQLGVETMSSTMAGIMRKAPDGERYVTAVDAALRELNRRRLLTKVFLILNHPGETAETAEQTVGYFERFVAEQPELSVIVNAQPFAYFPGSDIAQRLEHYERRYGTRVAHADWWTKAGDQHELATEVRPSRELADGRGYVERIHALSGDMVAKMPASAKLLFFRHLTKL